MKAKTIVFTVCGLLFAWFIYTLATLDQSTLSHPMENFEGRWGKLTPCVPNESYSHFTDGEGYQYDFLTSKVTGKTSYICKDKIRSKRDQDNALATYQFAESKKRPAFTFNRKKLYPFTPMATFVTYSDTTDATVYTFIRLNDNAFIYLSQDPKL